MINLRYVALGLDLSCGGRAAFLSRSLAMGVVVGAVAGSSVLRQAAAAAHVQFHPLQYDS